MKMNSNGRCSGTILTGNTCVTVLVIRGGCIMPDYFLKRLETNTPKTKVMQGYEINFYTQNQITIKLSVIKNLSLKQVKKTN